jgi:glucose-1-phosphate adenylyltransferase
LRPGAQTPTHDNASFHYLADVAATPNLIALVLAGGEGKRLYPLTRDRSKPAVPFGGAYRLIDFALSNLVNGGYRRIAVRTAILR